MILGARRGLAFMVLVATLLVLAPFGAAPARAASGPMSAVVTQTSDGVESVDIAPASSISLSAVFGAGNHLQIYGSFGSVTISPPTGQQLGVGTYSVSETADATHAGISYCGGPESGTLTISELTWDAGDTTVTAFAADDTITCQTATVYAQLRYQSSIPFTALVEAIPDFPEGPMLLAGASEPLTLTNEGSASVTVGTPSIIGGDAASFSIGATTCSTTLASGATCTVTVDVLPLRYGYLQPSIQVPDSSPRGYESAAVLMITDVNLNGRLATPLSQVRIADTRKGAKTFDGNNAGGGPIGPGATRSFFVSHSATVQGNGTDDAVVLNITVTGPTSSGFLTVFPNGSPRPTASSINFTAGQTIANLVTVRLDSSRRVAVFNHAGSANVVIDLVGYYPDQVSPDAINGFTFRPQQPYRLYDSRTKGVKLGVRQALQWTTPPGVRALAVNITVTGATAPGFVSAWTGPGNPAPLASTLNFRAGQTVSNMTVVTTGEEDGVPGYLEIGNLSTEPIDLIVDVVGYYDASEAGLHFQPTDPTRILDTRSGLGAPSAFGQGQTQQVAAPVSGSLTLGVVLNVTGLAGAHATYLTLWAAGTTRPPVSNLNPPAGGIIASMAMVGLSADGYFSVYNNTGTTNVVADLAGTLYGPPGAIVPALAPKALGSPFGSPTTLALPRT
jgi:hypothetical protein